MDKELSKEDIPTYCAWCKKHMSGPEGDYKRASHGMCPECYEKFMSEWKGVSESISTFKDFVRDKI